MRSTHRLLTDQGTFISLSLCISTMFISVVFALSFWRENLPSLFIYFYLLRRCALLLLKLGFTDTHLDATCVQNGKENV